MSKGEGRQGQVEGRDDSSSQQGDLRFDMLTPREPTQVAGPGSGSKQKEQGGVHQRPLVPQ